MVSSNSPARTLRILEIATGAAGPVVGRLFAALGHEVVCCEPPAGDPLRHTEPLDASGLSHAFVALAADKASVVADAATADGRARIEGMVGGADLVITDLPPAAAAAAGLDPERLRSRWPALVVVAVTGFGLDDARSEDGYDSLLAECYGGLAHMIGERDRPPLSLGGEQAAFAAGFAAFFGASVALAARSHDGEGDVVDVAVCDVAAYIDWKSDVTYAVTGKLPRRTGTSTGRWRILPATDGWVGVIYQPDQWDAMVALIGDPRLEDERWQLDATRRADGRWWAVVAEWAAARTKAQIYEEAQALGLAFGTDVDMAGLVASEQLAARGFFQSPRPRAPATGALVHSDVLAWRSGPAPALGSDAPEPWTPGVSATPTAPVTPPTGAASPSAANPPAANPPAANPPAANPSAANPSAATPAPLAGLRVVDFGTITAGAATTRLLADYGATVVKVESGDHPDSFRTWVPEGAAPAPDASFGTSAMFDSNNAGKFGLALDLKTPEGLVELDRLVTAADVLVENYSVGVPERLGIDYDRLRSLNPRLVYLSLSSQGQDGPEARRRSYGSTLDLLSGLASVTGYEGGSPMWSSADVNYPDQLVSLLGAGLVVHCVTLGIRGVHLDLAQREVVSWTLSDRLAEWRETGAVPRATGNRRAGRTPHDVYPCRGEDQWVALSCSSPAQRRALAVLVGVEAPGGPAATDATERWWWEHQDDVDARIAAWTSPRDKADATAELRVAGVLATPVMPAEERAVDPHFLCRRVFLPGPPRRKGFPLRLARFEPPEPTPAPRLGEHRLSQVMPVWERASSGPEET